MIQIVFNEISAAELSRLPTQHQFQLLEELNISANDLKPGAMENRFGYLERDGKKLFRCRTEEYRIYFAIEDGNVVVHRVLSRNSMQDFLFRSNLPGSGEDEALAKSTHFWQLIDEGASTLKAI